MTHVSRRLEDLSPQKRELFLKRLREKSRTTTAPAPDAGRIKKRPPGSRAPLSFGQQRLWFLDRFNPGSSTYNLASAVEIEGRCEVPVLAAAIAEVVRRHEILRTTFAGEADRGQEPYQVVAERLRLAVPVADLGRIGDGPRRRRQVLGLARELALAPYDLARGPLVRAMVLRLAERRHVLVLGMHHIVSDAWSSAIVIREISVLYRAFLAGEPSPLAEPSLQFADFAAWQRSWLQGDELERQLAFWKERLAGAPEVLELPTDRPRPPAQSLRGGRVPVLIPSALVARLKEAGQRRGATLFIALLAVFQTLLGRYAGAKDVVVGAPIAGHNRLEIEGLIGFLVNTLALRTGFTGKPGYHDLLDRVKATVHAAFEHQDLPFEKLVEELQPERDPSHPPLVQVVFNLLSARVGRLELPGLALRTLELDHPTAMFDLNLTLEEEEGSLRGWMEYDAALFDRTTIARAVLHLENLLAGALDRPDEPVSQLPWLTAGERAQLAREWNDTASELREVLVQELFSRQAERRPDAVAVSFGAIYLTYRDLDRRTNRLARLLRTLGVGRGKLVAILLDRSAEMVLCLLAVLKAGGAYLPLEKRNPPARMRWILETMGVEVMLAGHKELTTAAELMSSLPGLGHAVCPQRLPEPPPAVPAGHSLSGPEDFAPLPDEALAAAQTADDLAYVIFTSGSTGTPKGVMERHRPVVNLIEWVNRQIGMGPGDRVLFITSLGFDLSVYDVFGVLAAGGSVRVASQEEVEDPAALARILLSEPITFWDSAPVALQQLVPFLPGEVPAGGARPLRLVFLSGDWIPLALPDEIRASFPAAKVVALGGATEATVWSNFFRVGAVDPAWASIPYGRPIRNARYYVLDGRLELCPAGVPGDLYIAGGCLSSGYAAAPALSAAQYLPDPWVDGAGAVMYRTGDRARFGGDGNVEFLGRRDHQVKVRGFRIELGEIESALTAHAGVREAAVLVRRESSGARLVAHVVAAGAAPPDAAELRRFVGQRLPDYMVPSFFVFLDALPVTANGKLDRAALERTALPEAEPAAEGDAAPAPLTALEEILGGIWSEVLGRGTIGRHDNFFDLGGHSLLAVRVVSQVREVLSVELKLRQLFEIDTLAELALAVAEARDGGGPSLPPIVSVSRQRPLPLSFAQERLWFLDRLEPDSIAYNIPVAIDLRGELSVAAFAACLSAVARRHETLRTTFEARPGEAGAAVQVVAPPAPRPLPVVDLTALASARAEAERLAAAEARRPFRLETGPLLRSTLLRRAAGHHVLLLGMHHIVSDGWSMGLLVEEVTALYRAWRRAEPARLPELPVQYADFAAWQRSWLRGEELERQLGHWRGELEGAPTFLELTTDRPRPRLQSTRGAHRALELPESLGAGLEALGREAGATLFMTLLASWSILLGRQSGQDDVLVGSPIANRDRTEIEPLIGFFVNTLVLRTRLAGDPSFRDLLVRVRATALAAYAHQDLPFERLVEDLAVERDLSRSPLFQVMLMLQNVPIRAAELEGLALEPLATEQATAKFDLTLTVAQAGPRIVFDMEYNRDLFDPTTVDRSLARLARLLSAAVESPARRTSELTVLGRAERHQLLREWNDSAVATPVPGGLSELLRAGFESRADAVAVVSAGRQVSCRELGQQVRRLAGRLRREGVAAEVLVGVSTERCVDMVVALLGVLEAGGAYVPLDPEYPAPRLAFMLEDAAPRVVVTQSRLRDRLPDFAGRLLLTDEDPQAAPMPEVPAPGPTPGARLAYVIYTSGSTGRPKGVQIEHRSLINLLTSMARQPGLTERDTLVAVTTLSFDIAALEIFLPLLAGARLVVAGREQATDGPELARTLARSRATALQATPASWHLLLASAEPQLGGLKAICGGEALPRPLADRVLAAGAELWNVYGPTETTIWSAVRRIGAERGPISFGGPIDATSTYVLDRRHAAVPAGVPGELHIGGRGLARGYLRRPGLTAERFIPDAFGGVRGERLYKTGDLVRHLHDGGLAYLGRLDHQVKVRGFRIELGEIESALARHPRLGEVAVVVHDHGREDRRLAAYVVARGEAAPPADELRSFLARRLPAPMVPSAFVELDTLPRTPSGKIDRKALASTLPAAPSRAQPPAAPRNPLEEVLAGIWAEVLGLERVGVHDSFFDLGGHSLLGVSLFARVHRTLSVELPMRTLFEAPTVAQLAVLVAEAKNAGRESAPPAALPEIEPDPARRYEPFPLTDVQQAYWVGRSGTMALGDVSCHLYTEQDFIGLDPERLTLAWRRLVERHDMLRAVFLPDGVQRILADVPPYEIAVTDLTGEDRETADRHLAAVREEMSHQVLPADRWPLFDVRASLLAGGRVRLHVSFDLLIADAWSFQLLAEELLRLYVGEAPPAAPPELTFRDYVVATETLETSELFRRSRRYWSERLDTLPPAPELPLVKEPEAVGEARFRRRRGALAGDDWQRLKELSSHHGLTPSAVLLAAYAEVLATWSRRPHFSIVLTLFNRLPLHREVNDLVGDFTSLTLLEVEPRPDSTFAERGRALQERLWDDLDHRYYSSVRVLRELIPRRGWSSRAAMPVVFTSTLNMGGGAPRELPAELEGELVYGITQTPQVLIDHQVFEDAEGGLVFVWDAVEELFPDGVLDDMFGAFSELVAGLCADEAAWRRTAAVAVPPRQLERRAAVNATEAPLEPRLLHAGFEEQARRRPEHPAVVGEARTLDYGELARRVRLCAHRLRELGARPNCPVAVVMEKGWEQVVGALAVVTAGAPYLPVDSELPPARLELLLERGEVELALTQSWIDERLAWPPRVRRLAVDRESDWEGAPEEPLAPAQGWEDLAYVIFTSGSTGEPKGVAIDHRGAVNTLDDILRRFDLGPDDRVLALSALNFDLSVFDVFGTLAAGGTIVLPSAERRREPAHWAELVARERVTVWNSVPALLAMLVDYAGEESDPRLGSLRLALLSGDWIPLRLPDDARRRVPDLRVVSLGGATEASIWSIVYPIGEVAPEWKSVPYGRPLANQSFQVLDERLEPRPDWVPGELFIGGAGLARGYWRDEEKTGRSFIEHPHTGERLYRTGDLGRYLPEGDIEFLGREDLQVKIQGFRVELGEIEAALDRLPGVRDAVVNAVGERGVERRLIAYLTTGGAEPPSEGEARAHLAAELPAYMVPPFIVFLDELPLTANGKVDRQALPDPLAGDDAATAPSRELVNPVEQELLEICAELFPGQSLTIDDNFFALGGTSTRAVRFLAEIRDHFQVELPLGAVFQAATLADLATAILYAEMEGEQDADLAEALAELEGLSEEEVLTMLESERSPQAERSLTT